MKIQLLKSSMKCKSSGLNGNVYARRLFYKPAKIHLGSFRRIYSLVHLPSLTLVFLVFFAPVWLSPVTAQQTSQASVNLEQVRWKSETQVREMLGDPKSIRGPIGTHASYELWVYDGFTIAFANKRAFHIFDKNSLHKIELQENR
jgi:hypothetical protein